MCTQCVHEVSGEYSPEAHPCQFSTRAPSGGNYAKLDGFAGEYSLAARPCHEGLDCHTKFLGSTPWQRSLAARPWLEHSSTAHPWLGSTPRHPSSKTVTPSTSRPCSVEGWPLGRNSVHYIARRSLHGGLGRHAAALDKTAAWASPLAHVTRSRA